MAGRNPRTQGRPKDETYLRKTKIVQVPFLPFEKPFDDMQDLPDPRAYPKHLDIELPTSPTKDPIPRSAYSNVKEQENPRPWAVPDKNEKRSKRKRDTHSSLWSPHHRSGHNPLDRWMDEPGNNGAYHAIDSAVPTQKSSHAHDASIKKV